MSLLLYCVALTAALLCGTHISQAVFAEAALAYARHIGPAGCMPPARSIRRREAAEVEGEVQRSLVEGGEHDGDGMLWWF